jgi:hypothetical protein
MNIRVVVILMITALLFACSKEDNNVKVDAGHTVTFSVSQSRSSQYGNFEDGDAIGVFVYEASSKRVRYLNSKYVYNGKTFVPSSESDNIRVLSGASYNFYVYYPYAVGNSDATSISHTIPDQSAESGWIDADFLTATYDKPLVDYCVPLNFKHRNSTLQLIVTDGEGIDGAKIENIQTQSHYNLLDGSVRYGSSKETKGMYLYSNGNGISTFRITLPEQVIWDDNPISLLKSGQAVLKLKAATAVQLEAGKVHDYNLGYKKTVRINDYTTGGTTTGAGKYALKSTCTVTATPKTGHTFVGWFVNDQLISANRNYSFPVLEDVTLTPKYKSYGEYGAWSYSNLRLTASPSTIVATGGTSTITAKADRQRTRPVLWNGKATGETDKQTQTGEDVTASCTFSGNATGFTVSGNKVTAQRNTSGSSRSITVTGQYKGMSKTVTVTQSSGTTTYGDWVITVSASPETIAAAGGTSTITATAKRDVLLNGTKIDTETRIPTLSGSATGFTLSGKTVTASNNTTVSVRSITITATVDGKSKSCTVNQSAGVKSYGEYGVWSYSNLRLTASPSSIVATGGTSTITAKADRQRTRPVLWNGKATGETDKQTQTGEDVTASCTFSGNANGFTVSGNKVTASENTTTSSRSITVTGKYSGLSKTVTISQSGGTISETYTFELSSGSLTYRIESTGGTVSYTVNSYKTRTVNGIAEKLAVDYTATSNVAWITAGKTSSAVTDNPNTEMRTGTVTLKQNGSGKTITITIKQQKKVIIDIN